MVAVAGRPGGRRRHYWAADAGDLTTQFTYRLRPEVDGANGEGHGPGGAMARRFRAWKEDLLAHQ